MDLGPFIMMLKSCWVGGWCIWITMSALVLFFSFDLRDWDWRGTRTQAWQIYLLFLCLPPFSEYYVYSQFSEKAWTHLLVSQWTGEVQHVNVKYCKNWSKYQVSLFLQSVTVTQLCSEKICFPHWCIFFGRIPIFPTVLSMY